MFDVRMRIHVYGREPRPWSLRFARTQVSKFPNLTDSDCMSYCWFIITPRESLEVHG